MDTVRRAFELAAAGNCRSIDELRAHLRRERLEMVDAHLSAPSLRTQLKSLMRSSLSAPARGTGPSLAVNVCGE